MLFVKIKGRWSVCGIAGKTAVCYLHSLVGTGSCPGFRTSSAYGLGKAAPAGPHAWVSTTHAADTEDALGSLLQPGPAMVARPSGT